VRTSRRLAALLGTALLAGCASVPADAGFAEAAALARERDGLELTWRRGGAEDAALAERQRALTDAELELEGAVELALLGNQRLQALYSELGFAQAEVLAAARLPNPVLHGELRFPEGGGGTAIDLGIEQSFLALLWMPLRKRLAADAFELAQLRVAEGALGLASDVRGAYRALQGAQQELELAHTALEAAEASFELARRLHEAGNIRDLDLALERAQREEARVALSEAELAQHEAREDLAVRLGVWGEGAGLRVTARLPELPAEALPVAEPGGTALANSLRLAAMRREIESAGRRLDLTGRMRLVPDLELGVVAEREAEGHWELGPSLALPLPLFDRGEPALRRAAAELERLRADYQAEAVELRGRVRRVSARLVALHARAAFLRDVLVPLRGEVTAGFQLEYNAMQEGAFRLLLAKRDEVAAGAAYLRALTDYWTTRAELDGLLAGAAPHGSPSPERSPSSMASAAAPSDSH